jgi:hypothetical protein
VFPNFALHPIYGRVPALDPQATILDPDDDLIPLTKS